MKEAKIIYFDTWYFDPKNYVLTSNGKKEYIGHQSTKLLVILVQSWPTVVSRKQIMQEIWTEDSVKDVTINAAISRLRAHLPNKETPIVKTIPKQGYQLTLKPQNKVTYTLKSMNLKLLRKFQTK